MCLKWQVMNRQLMIECDLSTLLLNATVGRGRVVNQFLSVWQVVNQQTLCWLGACIRNVLRNLCFITHIYAHWVAWIDLIPWLMLSWRPGPNPTVWICTAMFESCGLMVNHQHCFQIWMCLVVVSLCLIAKCVARCVCCCQSCVCQFVCWCPILINHAWFRPRRTPPLPVNPQPKGSMLYAHTVFLVMRSQGRQQHTHVEQCCHNCPTY